MTEAQKMRERHRQEVTALYVKTFNQHGTMRKAAKALGISAATLCLYFKNNGCRLTRAAMKSERTAAKKGRKP